MIGSEADLVDISKWFIHRCPPRSPNPATCWCGWSWKGIALSML